MKHWSTHVQLVKELDCPESDLHRSRRVGKANLPSTWSHSCLLKPVVEGQNKMGITKDQITNIKVRRHQDCGDLRFRLVVSPLHNPQSEGMPVSVFIQCVHHLLLYLEGISTICNLRMQHSMVIRKIFSDLVAFTQAPHVSYSLYFPHLCTRFWKWFFIKHSHTFIKLNCKSWYLWFSFTENEVRKSDLVEEPAWKPNV